VDYAHVPIIFDHQNISPYIDYNIFAFQQFHDSAPVQQQDYPALIAVNSGGESVSGDGVTWSQDNSYTTPSLTYSAWLNFDNPVYRTERNGAFSYSFAVANGPHTVLLKFAEIRFRTPGRRVFDVVINGNRVINDLDLVAVAGYGVPYDLSFQVDVTDNQIQIDFIPLIYRAKVSAIEITAN
jgi:hypothetical protein